MVTGHTKKYSEEELLLMDEYLSKYEGLYERMKKAMESIGERIIGKDPIIEYKASPSELALGQLSSVMKRLKQDVLRVCLILAIYCSARRKKPIICS